MILNLKIANLDGLSTITFIPYIGTYFSKEYITANYVGETLCSMIPAILALIQEFGLNDSECINSNNTSNFTGSDDTNGNFLKMNFGVSTYFFLMFILMLLSIAAFITLHESKYSKKSRKIESNNSKSNTDYNEINSKKKQNIRSVTKKESNNLSLMYFLTFLISFFIYGFMPGLVSYSTLPYGNFYFQLTINSNSFTAPIAIFLTVFSSNPSSKKLALETLTAILFSLYIIFVSLKSPCPIFVNTPKLGGFIITFVWNISSGYFLYETCLIAMKLEKYGEKVLYKFSCITVFGNMLGSFFIFLLVEILNIFKDKDKCSINNC